MRKLEKLSRIFICMYVRLFVFIVEVVMSILFELVIILIIDFFNESVFVVSCSVL